MITLSRILVHIGKKIKEIIKATRNTNIWVADQLSMTRQGLNGLFGRETVDTGTLARLSIILKHDFFQYYTEYVKQELTKTEGSSSVVEEPETKYEKGKPGAVLKIEITDKQGKKKEVDFIKMLNDFAKNYEE